MGFKNWLLKTHNDMITKNQGRISLFVGDRGTSKSWTAISLGNILTKGKFDPEKHISFFSSDKLINLIDNSRPGDYFIFDDCGLGMDSRQWNIESNIILSHVFQICRPKQIWIAVTVPSQSMVDVRLRSLANDLIIMKGFNQTTRKSRADWRVPNKDFFRDKAPFWNRLKVGGKRYGLIHFNAPPRDMCEKYERLRGEASDSVLKHAQAVKAGLSKAVTVTEASNMLGMPSHKISQLASVGSFPLATGTKTVKIPLEFINKVAQKIPNNERPLKVHKELPKKGLAYIILPDGRFLFRW